VPGQCSPLGETTRDVPQPAAILDRVRWDLVAGVAAGLACAWLLLLVVLWVLRPRDARLGELIRVVPDVLRLCRVLLADRAVPLGVKAALAGLALWLLNPIDLVPEFVPVLGPLDDVVVAVIVLRYVWRRMGGARMQARWPGSADGYALLRGVVGSG
jgi:uncharacterized membrane protein YkvA (DUF1232 family)